MSFSNLTKEQKQYMAIGAIAAVALVATIVFGIKFSLSSITESKLELDDLSQKIEEADRALSSQDQIRSELVETARKLKAILEKTPPDRNYYSWVSEIIYEQARLAGLEIDAINEQNRAANPPAGKGNSAIKLESYSLRITARGGFGDIRAFLEQIEEEQPLARVVGVDISSGSSPEIHAVQLFIQWPFGMDAITDAWDAIDEKQEELGRRAPDLAEQPQSAKTAEAEAPLPVSNPEKQLAAKEPSPEVPSPKAELPQPAKTLEPETPVSVPKPEALPAAGEPAPKKMPPPPVPRPGAEAKDPIAEPVASEIVGPLPPETEPEGMQESEVPAEKIQPLESSGDDGEASLAPLETEQEQADEAPATIQEERDSAAVQSAEPQQEELGKSANLPEAQPEEPHKPSSPTMESFLEMFKE